MIFPFLLFWLLAIILYLISQKIQQRFYQLVFLITGSEKIALFVFTAVFLPGTVIHELSHFFVAFILRIPTGELSIMPTVKKNGNIQAGKLMIAETDPFRRSIVGLSPFFIGLILIYIIGKTLIPVLSTPVSDIKIMFNTNSLLLSIICYLLLVITTTMFSSKKDVESLVVAIPITALILISLYLVGVRIFLAPTLYSRLKQFFSVLNFYLLLSAVLGFLLLLFINLNILLWQKIKKVRIEVSG